MAPPPSHHVCDIRSNLCFRCVWSRRASTTTPSSRKWERTHQPSRCSSRNWARSNARTRTAGSIHQCRCDITRVFPHRHLVPLTDLKPVNPVPAWNVAAPSRKGDLGAFFFSIHSLFYPFPVYSPDFLYGLFLSLPQTRTLVVSGITAIATSGNLVG